MLSGEGMMDGWKRKVEERVNRLDLQNKTSDVVKRKHENLFNDMLNEINNSVQIASNKTAQWERMEVTWHVLFHIYTQMVQLKGRRPEKLGQLDWCLTVTSQIKFLYSVSIKYSNYQLMVFFSLTTDYRIITDASSWNSWIDSIRGLSRSSSEETTTCAGVWPWCVSRDA